jgi:hypothetical protein
VDQRTIGGHTGSIYHPVTYHTSCSCSVHVGSENVVKYARENQYIVKTLKEFQYIDEEGKDQGSNGKLFLALDRSRESVEVR